MYVDNNIDKEEFRQRRENSGFLGYHLLYERDASMMEIYRFGHALIAPAHEEELHGGYFTPLDFYAVWNIFERDAGRGVDHGPAKFSLLFICDDGVGAYRSLFNAQLIRPLMIVLFYCGCYGVGGNWTDYTRREMSLAETVFDNPAGPPAFLLLDGPHGMFDTDGCCWPDEYKERLACVDILPVGREFIRVWRLGEDLTLSRSAYRRLLIERVP